MTDSLIYWYQDDSSNGNYYTVYASQETINKIGYKPMYFEYAKKFADYGPIIVVVYNRYNINSYSSYVYKSSTDNYWSKKIYNLKDIDYDNRHSVQFSL
jgi:hypothetical protein